MPQADRLPRRHLQTFARLRAASPMEVADLETLEQHVVSPSDRLNWPALVGLGAATVIAAHEGESLVGAIVMTRAGNAAKASISWIGVCPSARGRGVGTLLLDAAVSAARDDGAAVLVAEPLVEGQALSRLLATGGFQPSAVGTVARWKRVLWSRGEATAVIRLSFA